VAFDSFNHSEIRNPRFAISSGSMHPAPCSVLSFISARPAILPSNSRMIPDEIRQRFTAITLILNPSAFILGIAPLLALYAIAHVLRRKSRMVACADSGNALRRLAMQQLRPDPQRVFRSRNFEVSQTELSDHKVNEKTTGRVRRLFTQRNGASKLDLTPKIGNLSGIRLR